MKIPTPPSFLIWWAVMTIAGWFVHWGIMLAILGLTVAVVCIDGLLFLRVAKQWGKALEKCQSIEEIEDPARQWG